jgi:hypothetical protein
MFWKNGVISHFFQKVEVTPNAGSLTQPGRSAPPVAKAHHSLLGCLPVLRSGSHTVCLPCKLEAPGCAAQAAWEVPHCGRWARGGNAASSTH